MNEPDSKLSHLWSNFCLAENDSKEKKKWFDLFLAHILFEFPNYIPPDAFPIEVPDIIAREFMAEIRGACTEFHENDELAPLKKYLLCEQGWRCLTILHRFKDLKISKAYELCNLLVSLFAVIEGDGFDFEKSSPYLVESPRKSIDEVVEGKLDTMRKKTEKLRKNSNGRMRGNKNNDSKLIGANRNSLESDSSLPSLSSFPALLVTDSKLMPTQASSFFSKPTDEISSSTDSVFHQQTKNEDYMKFETFESDAIQEILDSSLNCREYGVLILNLLQELCNEEALRPEEYEELIDTVIRFVLEHLNMAQYRHLSSHSVAMEEIKFQLAYLMMTCMNGVKRCRKMADTMCHNGTLLIFLQLLQDVSDSTYKCDNKQFLALHLDFFYTLIFSVLNLFVRLLSHENVTKNLRFVNKLFRQFVGVASGRLYENIIRSFFKVSARVDRTICLKRVKIIVSFLGFLIVRFKKLRRKVTRFEQCRAGLRESKEISCELPSHHTNLFGKPYKPMIFSPGAQQENCCITSAFVVMVKVVLDDLDEELTLGTLRVLSRCGSCCCVPAHWYVPKLLKLLCHPSSRVRHALLAFMERKLFADIDMFNAPDCSLYCTFDQNRSNKWKHLDEYKTLLSNENPKTVRLVGAHLFRMFPSFSYDVQRHLIVSVISSIFKSAREEYPFNDPRAKDVMLICLAIMSEVAVNRAFAAELESILSNKDVRSMLLDANFTESCCRMLETRIICKTSKLEDSGNSFIPVLIESCTTELNILVKSLEEYSNDIVKAAGFVETCFDTDSKTIPLNVEQAKKLLPCLKAVSTTLERLIIRSTVVKSYFDMNSIKTKFQDVLLFTLSLLAKRDYFEDKSVYEMLLKLVQPLLILCLSLFDDKNGIEIRVKDLLNEALKAGNVSLKQVCDALLSMERIENVRKEEESWGTEPLFDECLSDSGCEADDEVISWSNVDGAFSETSEEGNNKLASLLESCSESVLLYPTVCTIAVELINSLRVDQCTEETMYCLHHITNICKRNSDICEELTKQNMVAKLLGKLEESLGEELLTPEETDVQYAITQLLSVLFHHRVENAEFSQFFNLFKLKRAPFDHLTNALVSIVNKSHEEVVPSFYFNFPAASIEDSIISDEPAEALLQSMREIHKRGMSTSPWVVCGLALPLSTSFEWCMWISGFSLSFWLKYNKLGDKNKSRDDDSVSADSSNDELVHLISVGYDTLVLETWIDESNSCFVVRLTRPDGNRIEILSQAMFQRPLNDGQWHHVVLNVKDTMKHQKIALEVSLTLDGLHRETRYLVFIAIFMRKVRPACVLIGETRHNMKSRYSFSNLMMFRSPVLSAACCFTIRAFGTDLENILTCPANATRPNFVNMSFVKDASRDFSLTDLLRQLDENMRRMRENMLISFTPRECHHFYFYSQTDSSLITMAIFPPAAPGIFRKPKSLQSDQLIPQTARTAILSSIPCQQRNTFYARIHEQGGFSFLAYLFAMIIESCQSESIQSNALRLILKACFADARLYSEFVSSNGYNIIAKVMTSSRFRLSRLTFVELTDAMCSKPAYFSTVDEFSTDNEVYLCNPQIVTTLLLPHWRLWEKCDAKLLVTLFRGLHSMVNGTNSYRMLNTEQLISVDIIDRTMDMCKEKFFFEEKDSNVNNDLCSAILEFIKTMIGTPPSIDHISAIIDYLYVVHPTSLSFCSNSSKGYYFLFSSLSQHKRKKQVSLTPTTEEAIDLETVLNPLAASPEQSNGNFGRSLSKSMAEMQEKPEMSDAYWRRRSSSRSDEDEYKECKEGTDSGIAGCQDDQTVFSYESSSLPKDERTDELVTRQRKNTEQNVTNFYEYAALNFGPAFGECVFSDHGCDFKDDCNQYIISVGLLDMIHDTILVLPDCMVETVFKKIVDYRLFLILANHPHVNVRNTVVKTVLAWLVRCDEEERVKFVVHTKGFYHLANQLALYPATEELVNSCISLLTRCHWDVLEQIAEMEEVVFPSLHFSSLPPLLAVFPGTVHNFNLAMSITRFFKLLITKVSQALKKLIENGLVESLVKTILILVHADVSGGSLHDNTMLLTEIIDLFALIMSTCIQTPGVLYSQIMNEIVFKCRYLEVTEEALCGMDEDCVQIIHNLHCTVLQSGLDTVLSLIEMHHTQDVTKGRRSPSFITSMTGSMSASLSSIPSSLMSFASPNGKQKHLSRGELTDRYKLILTRATEYLQFSSSSVVTDKDLKFACHLFTTLINGVSNIVQNKSYIRFGSPWSSVFWAARETLRTQTANLLIWMMTPTRPVYLRLFVVETLLNEPKAKDIVSTLVFINSETEQRYTIFLWNLIHSDAVQSSQSDRDMCEDFKNCLVEWEILPPHVINQIHDRWQVEASAAIRELSVVYWNLEKSQQNAVYNSVYKMETLSKKISELAVSISAAVNERQGKERKKLLQDMRKKYRSYAEARIKWRRIIQQMSHEQAPWFDPETYPNGWELDPTEGPGGVRKRLKRCYLNIEKKFFKKEHVDKIRDQVPIPLSYLFESGDSQTFCTLTLDLLSMDDTICHMCYAIHVQPGYEVEGELLLGERRLYFIASHIGEENLTTEESEKFSIVIEFKEVKEIHNRRFQLKECAIEFFSTSEKLHFFSFHLESDRDNFVTALNDCALSSRITNDLMLGSAVDKWKEGGISNWDYLKTLNKVAGRSYNDLMQYPIMPFILADYKNDSIDLRDEKVYRNLKKPMAVQDKKKEQYFINHYNCLKTDATNGQNMNSVKPQPYHYASHYSNSGTVLHYLLRLPPFTQVFLQYQDNNFDLPDRTFHSLDTTWRLATSDSTTDVKELIPEFFYLPEFLMNLENFNFGVRQNGEVVDNVKLPAWANGDARLFVLIHRQMLESEYVRENLCHWIDLIFGFKQTGKAAIDAINVFHPATYYGFDVDSIRDPVDRVAWETMIRMWGQTPRQLFRSRHPMVVQNLMVQDDRVLPVLKGIRGIKWGNYVGSPSREAPTVLWNHSYVCPVPSLVPLVTNDVFGLPSSTSLLISYNKERSSVNLLNEGVNVMGAALLSWNHLDGIIRIKERRETPQIPIIFCPPKDPISVCATAPDCPLIWIGLASGNILVFRFSFQNSAGGIDVEKDPVVLLGHKQKVSHMYLCPAFGIAVSVGEDELAIIWDLNDLTYIRTIPSVNMPLSLVCVSETLGDIATVAYERKSYSSTLRVHTINAALVGSVTLQERITAICYSSVPEGTSVNVIAIGLHDGVIRLWSSWDLSPIRDICTASINSPILSLTFSFDSQHLYASVSDGNVFIWESSNGSNVTVKTPKFLNLTTVN